MSLNTDAILEEISSVTVADANIVGTVFVIPIEAALPTELKELSVPTGTLYQRLHALDGIGDSDFGIVAISAQEFVDIAPAWRTLSTVKKAAVLLDLPGARYPTLFTLGYKQAGLQTYSWPMVADAVANRVRTRQRVTDKMPQLQLDQKGKALDTVPPSTETDDDGDDYE